MAVKTVWDSWLAHFLLFVYVCVVLGNAGFHFWHGWAHAEASRTDAQVAAISCAENPAIQRRHAAQCAHDFADANMNSLWFAWRALAMEFTFCPPTSCSEVGASLADFISRIGIAAVFAASAAMVAALVMFKLLSLFRVDERRIMGPGGFIECERGSDQNNSQANADWALLEDVRHRRPVVTEIS